MQSFQFVTVLYVNLFSGLFIVTCCRSFVVRFFTKIQDQIKNPDNSDFSLRKETMYRPVAMFFFYGEVRSDEETNQMRPKGRVSRWGGTLVVWDWIAYKFAVGVLTSNALTWVNYWGPGVCFPGKVLNLSPLKWLEMHLKLTWCGENLYIFSNKKRRHKKTFSPQNAWYNNNYSPNLRPCSITEVYLHVELKHQMRLANKNLYLVLQCRARILR